MMALQRAFSFGRFKCSNASAKIIPAEYLRDGYVLIIKKNLVSKFCLACIEDFFSSKGLRVIKNGNYLTIESPTPSQLLTACRNEKDDFSIRHRETAQV